MKKNYIIVVLILIIIMLLGAVFYLAVLNKTAPSVNVEVTPTDNNNLTTPPTNTNVNINAEVQNKNIKTYNGSAFSFQYPTDLTLGFKGEAVTLTHAVDYRHNDLCNMRDGVRQLNELTDFNVTLAYYKKPMSDTIQATVPSNMVGDYLNGTSLKVTPGFIDEYQAGNLKGYKITSGAEGCGVYTYYFPLTSGTTLYATQAFVPEFQPINPDYQKYLRIPGIISPDKEETYFQTVVTSFKAK